MVASLACLVGVVASFSLAYLLLHLVGALVPSRRCSDGAGDASNLIVLIPAHDEELVLGATLASLAAQDCLPGQVIVIADNCTDDTARIARESGATVWERTDPERRGKGYALAWAVERALRPSPALTPSPSPEPLRVAFGRGELLPFPQQDASGLGEGAGGWGLFAVLDADTQADPGFCREIARALRTADAVQGRYGVLSPGDGWRVGLMAAAFALVNHVRPLGADRLGGFVGLKGNGMGFTRQTLERVCWRGDSVTEDLDFALDLALAGIRIRYAPLAKVAAQMPTGDAPAATQRRRWEGGRAHLVKTRALPMLRAGKLGAALELLVPPLGELALVLGLWGALSVASGAIALQVWWALGVLGLAVYIFGGLMVSGVGASVWLALLRAPFYVLWKLALRLGGPRGQGEWVRTARDVKEEAAP